MKTLYPFFFFLMLLFVSTTTTQAQDTIVTKQKQIIVAKILEIGTDDVKYKEWTMQDGPDFVITKESIDKITFSNGKTMMITADPMAVYQEEKILAKKNCIKIEFFSPLTNDLCFGYEHVIRVGKNLETKLGIIGFGNNAYRDKVGGVFAKAGLKFLKGSDYVWKGLKYAHPLRGSYIKPEIILSYYQKKQTYDYYSFVYNPYSYSETATVTYFNAAANIVFGRQVILGNIVTFDYYVGLGYGFQLDNHKKQFEDLEFYEEYFDGYAYSHVYAGDNFPLVISGGVTLGYIFK